MQAFCSVYLQIVDKSLKKYWRPSKESRQYMYHYPFISATVSCNPQGQKTLVGYVHRHLLLVGEGIRFSRKREWRCDRHPRLRIGILSCCR